MRRRLSNIFALLCHRDNIQKVFNLNRACCSCWSRSDLDGKRGGVLWKLYCFINLRVSFIRLSLVFRVQRETQRGAEVTSLLEDKKFFWNHPSSHRLQSIIFRASIHVWFLIEYSNLFPTSWIQLSKVNILKWSMIDSRLSSGLCAVNVIKIVNHSEKGRLECLERFKSSKVKSSRTGELSKVVFTSTWATF